MKRTIKNKESEIINAVKKQKEPPKISDEQFQREFSRVSKIPIVRHISFYFYKEGWFNSIVLFLAMGLYLFFSLTHITKFVYTDEPVLWLFNWIPGFWDAFEQNNWDEFGRSLSYPALPVLFLGSLFSHNMDLSGLSPENFQEYLFLVKAPVVFFNFICIFFIYRLSKNLFSGKHALLLTVLVSLHPLIISFSQHTQGDTTLWSTFILAILGFFNYLKSGKYKYTLITSFFFSLAVLSKFTGILLYPLFFIFLYAEYLFGTISRQNFKTYFKGLLLIYLGLLIFVFLFFPTCHTSFDFLLKSTFNHVSIEKIRFIFPAVMLVLAGEVFFSGKLSAYLIKAFNIKKVSLIILSTLFLLSLVLTGINKYSGNILFVPEDSGIFGDVLVDNFSSSLYFSFDSLLQLMPWFFWVGIGVFSVLLLKKSKEIQVNYLIHILIIVLIFFIGSALNNFQMWVKYLIFLIPLMYLAFTFLIIPVFPKYSKVIISIFLVFSVLETASSYPNYFFYRNQFIPFQFDAQNKVDGNYGGFELAQIANKLPGADTLKVLSDTYGFHYFFKGKDDIINKFTIANDLIKYDYLFLSSFGKAEKTAWKMLGASLKEYYEKPLDSSIVYIGDESGWVKLVKVDKERLKKTLPNSFDPMFFIDLSSAYSLSFLINTSNSDFKDPFLIGRTSEKGIYVKFEKAHNSLSQSNDSISLFFQYKPEGVKVDTDPINDSNWHHVVWYQTGGKIGDEFGIYLDGKLEEKAQIKKNRTGFVKFFISKEFKGALRDVRIYDFKLNKLQTEKIYNNGTFNFESELSVNGETFYPIQHYTIKKQAE